MSSAPSSHETVIYQPPAEAVKKAYVSGMAAYDKLCAEADADYAGYWARLARVAFAGAWAKSAWRRD